MRSTFLKSGLVALGAALLPAVALAQNDGGPRPWEVWLQPPQSPVDVELHAFMGLLQWIITAIALFVLVLLLYACWRFAESRNPVPSRRSHNTVLEIVWTGVPVLILIIIAIPSFKLLYFVDVVPKTDMTLKAIGHQWYWSYEYPDNGKFTFDANLVDQSDLKPGQKYLLQTDNEIVLPVETNIRLQTTATDVIHSWTIQQFGIKLDAEPGHLNQVWFRINEPGMYYGQCSELCGVNHGYMPITIKAVSKEEFDAWVKDAQKKFARADEAPVSVAQAAAAPTAR
jgi:cytochrome c oxidase subunit 2